MQNGKWKASTYEQFCEELNGAGFARNLVWKHISYVAILITLMITTAYISHWFDFTLHEWVSIAPEGFHLWSVFVWCIPAAIAIGYARGVWREKRAKRMLRCQQCQFAFGYQQAIRVEFTNACPSCLFPAYPCEEKGSFYDVPDNEVERFQSSEPGLTGLPPKPGKTDDARENKPVNILLFPLMLAWRGVKVYFSCVGNAAREISASSEEFTADLKERYARAGLRSDDDTVWSNHITVLRRQSALWLVVVFIIPNIAASGWLYYKFRTAPPSYDDDYTMNLIQLSIMAPIIVGAAWLLGAITFGLVLRWSPQFIRRWFGAVPTPMSAKAHEGSSFYGVVIVPHGSEGLPVLNQHAVSIRYRCDRTTPVEFGLLNRPTQREYRLLRTLHETADWNEIIIRFAPTLQYDGQAFQGDALRIIPPAGVSLDVLQTTVLRPPAPIVEVKDSEEES